MLAVAAVCDWWVELGAAVCYFDVGKVGRSLVLTETIDKCFAQLFAVDCFISWWGFHHFMRGNHFGCFDVIAIAHSIFNASVIELLSSLEQSQIEIGEDKARPGQNSFNKLLSR